MWVLLIGTLTLTGILIRQEFLNTNNTRQETRSQVMIQNQDVNEMRKQIGCFNYVDAVSSDETYVSVCMFGDHAGLTLSLSRNGDVEVFLGKAECEKLIANLQKALGELRV